MSKIEEIQALVALNAKLRKQRDGFRCVSANCTFVVLTRRIVLNEAALRKAYQELAAS